MAVSKMLVIAGQSTTMQNNWFTLLDELMKFSILKSGVFFFALLFFKGKKKKRTHNEICDANLSVHFPLLSLFEQQWIYKL